MGFLIKTYKGLYNGTQIILDDNSSVPARAYASNQEVLKNKRGFFNVKFLDDWDWGIIIQAHLIDDE